MDVISYIVRLLNQAMTQRVSDIHFEPHPLGLLIRQRVDGFLIKKDHITPAHASAITSRLKIMGNLDIGEKRIPQDGMLTFTQLEGSYDIRISTMPTIHGEKIVLRLVKNKPDASSLYDLGMNEQENEQVNRLLTRSSGLLVTTGPTGSGKTSTLYAMLQKLNKEEMNIITLEDPIELQIPGVNQVQIHPKAGLTFARGLRAALRQDPDVIMIGEIRDIETADIAIGAALTGHLVMTTLHTLDAASVVTRLLDMKIEPYRVAASLSGMIAQRLVRLLCKECAGQRCDHCQQTGYYGRTGVFEMITVDDMLQRMIVERKSLIQIRQWLKDKKVPTLSDAVKRKVVEGKTTMEEYMRVVDYAEEKRSQEV